MATTTSEAPETDAPAPEERAAELERDLRTDAEVHDEARTAVLRHLEAAAEKIERMRAAAARHRRRRVEADALEDALPVDVDAPEIDNLDLSPDDGPRDEIDDARDAVEDALSGESTAERMARSARTVFDALRAGGGPDEVRRRVRQLRDRLGDPAWMTADVTRDAWIRPAEDRRRASRERAVVERALRWCASAWRGRVPGDPRDVFPETVAEIVGEFFETGALENRNGPWVVPRRWYPAAAEIPSGELVGDRDLEAELRDAVAELGAAVLKREERSP